MRSEQPRVFKSYKDYEGLTDYLVGRRIVSVQEPDTLVLDDGGKLVFEQRTSDCCSWVELEHLAAADNIITQAFFGNTPDDEGPYLASLYVITDAYEINEVARARGDASNGFYLRGFSLDIALRPEEAPNDGE